MVLLGSEYWRKEIEAIPFARRILLLPHCLRKEPGCPATYDSTGLLCRECGACELAALKNDALARGYTVLIAEGTPIVMQMILGGKADAILGVGCLNSLERAFEKLQLAGIPAAAVPLFESTCRNTHTDIEWVREMIATPFVPTAGGPAAHSSSIPDKKPPSWLHLLRGAARLFEKDQLARLIGSRPRNDSVPEGRQSSDSFDAIGFTERAALDFLVRGGKFYRPFMTLAVYDALTGSRCMGEDGPAHIAAFPDPLKRIAVAIEVFHKASLLHDDIEDDDAFRYGTQTAHREYGIPTAINLGDYLIGLGYRLIASQAKELGTGGGAITSEILLKLAQAHTKLCEGQGSELIWKAKNRSRIDPSETLKIYGLKTSPAFEAAIFAGLRLGIDAIDSGRRFLEATEQPLGRFGRFLGIAFQIKNDLEDWDPPNFNKNRQAGDIFDGRPTLLWALALDGLQEQDRQHLLDLVDSLRSRHSHDDDLHAIADAKEKEMIELVRELYEKGDVFVKANRLIDKYAARAEEAIAPIEHEPLRNLLLHFLSTILGR